MKTKILSNKSRPANIKATYNPDLDKYEGKVLFPEKLAKANETLRKNPIPAELLSKP